MQCPFHPIDWWDIPKIPALWELGMVLRSKIAAVKQRNPQNLHKNEIFMLPPINLYTTNKTQIYEDYSNVLIWLNHQTPKNWTRKGLMPHESHAESTRPTQRSLAGGFRQCTTKIIRAPLERTWIFLRCRPKGGKRPWKSYSRRSKPEKLKRRVTPMYNDKGSSDP